MPTDYDERIKRETEFHNQRFCDGDDRTAQDKYYFAVSEGCNKYNKMVDQAASGSCVLEYGCGDASNFLRLAPLSKTFHAIDISDVAIARAIKGNRFQNASFHVMDAMNLTFPEDGFDLVFGSGIIHHLDTQRASEQIAKVLKPGGKAIFWEPLGMNPAINLYRFLTPGARTPDEHPLMPPDFRIMLKYFSTVEIQYFGLATLAAVPFRSSKIGKPLLRILSLIDSVVLSIPGVRNLGWYSLIRCVK